LNSGCDNAHPTHNTLYMQPESDYNVYNTVVLDSWRELFAAAGSVSAMDIDNDAAAEISRRARPALERAFPVS
jgi:hypothetical protein